MVVGALATVLQVDHSPQHACPPSLLTRCGNQRLPMPSRLFLRRGRCKLFYKKGCQEKYLPLELKPGKFWLGIQPLAYLHTAFMA